MKLNLGSGRKRIKGYTNVDIAKEVNPDRIADLDQKLEFEDNSIDGIISEEVIEHLNYPIQFIEECHRILKKGRTLEVSSPHASNTTSAGELHHKRIGLSVFSFHYTTEHSIENRQYYSKARFKIKEVKLTVNPLLQWMADLSPIKYEAYLSRFFPPKEIRFKLEKKEVKKENE